MAGISIGEKEMRLQGRAFLYQMAHVVFSGEPNASLLDVLGSSDCSDTLRGMAGENDTLVELAEFCDDLAANVVDRKSLLDETASTYNRCVMGLGANRESYPWESAYTSSKKLLFQVETLEVRNAYRAFGYLPEMYPKVADDHIALECAFMSALAGKTLAAEGDELERLVAGQCDFLENHLLKWIGRYAADLHADAPGSLYDLVAAALAEYAEADLAFLRALSNE